MEEILKQVEWYSYEELDDLIYHITVVALGKRVNNT